MSRAVRDYRLETRAARDRLAARPEPYWILLMEGFHLGYYRGRSAGKWVVRHRPPGRKGGYNKATLGEADDSFDADGSRFLNFRQAQDKARDWLRAIEGGARISTNLTVNDALDDYLEAFTKKDLVNTKRRIEQFIRPALGHLKLQQLTSSDVLAFHSGRANAPARLRTRQGAEQQFRPLDTNEAKRRRKATANRDLTVLKAALNFAYKRGLVVNDRAWKSVSPFRGVDSARLRYLTDDEARRLVNAAGAEFRPIVQAALLTGARWGELRNIHVSDVDLAQPLVMLRETKGGGNRVCYLEEEGAELFRQHSAGKASSELVFPGPDGSRWNDAQQIRRMSQACADGRVDPVASFHDLRRTFGARLAMAGVPMAVISEALGHKDERITRRHYAHLSKSYVSETVREHARGLAIVERSNVAPLAAYSKKIPTD